MFVQLNAQNRNRIEESIIAQSGFVGIGDLLIQGDPLDLETPFNYRYTFQASDAVDFSVVGGMTLPEMPGAESTRDIYTTTSAEDNLTPFYCNDSVREETYVVTLPDTVPIIAIPRSSRFRNKAGDYAVEWTRQGRPSPPCTGCNALPCVGRRPCASHRITARFASSTSRCAGAFAARSSTAI